MIVSRSPLLVNRLFDVANVDIYNERIAIILGLLALVLALAIFASCRVFITILARFGINNIAQNRAYQSFNHYHLLYWGLFGAALVSHLTMSILHTGLPQSGDADAGTHWMILSFGASGFIIAMLAFGSCRVAPRILTSGKPQNLINRSSYKSYFRYHAFFWLVLAITIGVHIAIAFGHAGIWPT